MARPDNIAAPQSILSTSALNFDDQYAFSIGTRYQWNELTWLMFGFTYGQNPIPDENLNPIMSVIGEQHWTFGITRQISPKWKAVATFFYMPENKVSYKNTSLPLGENATQSIEGVDFSLTFERNW